MTSVEKRRSSRKSGGHRKHSDGGFSDTSSGGSFLDETDREVRSLTDKAFRSLCIGDEAVYNDSDLGPASPCIPRERQRAFSQGGREKANNEEVKRAAHESFSEMVRQYEQDWINEGMYRAEMNRNLQWEGCEDGTHDKVSATFRDCFMEMTQENRSPVGDSTGYCSNGATDLSLQHRRSRSRVSSLIRAFNTEEGVVMDDQLREWNNETQWNRPGLMNMPSYQQNFTNGHVPIVGQFSSQNTSLYSMEAGAHINTDLSFMGMSPYNQNMMTQENCNTNFFIHSEFSPFKVWGDHNRCQQEEVSRFMHYSECPKWGKTPMYKERSLEPQMNGFSMFQEKSRRHHRAMTTTVAPNHHLQSISNARLQKASSLEKRCESEQAVHHPHTTRTMSLGTKRLQSQRPSTASPTVEMPRHFQETIYSVKGLHQQIKILSETNSDHQMKDSRQKAICNDTLCAVKTEGHIASYGISDVLKTAQLLSSPVSQAEPAESRQDPVSSQLVEHSPVRAESRGGTPDIRMPSYRSRASNLLFNLKDNRKRVKSTYSPAKFKGIETTEKSMEAPLRESKDIVIDIPECFKSDLQESSWMEKASHQNVKPYHSPSLLSPRMISQPDPGHISDCKAALRQDEVLPQFGYIVANDNSNHLNSVQNYSEAQPPFTPFKQHLADMQGGGESYTGESYYNTTDMHWQMNENSNVGYLKEADVRHFTEKAQLNQKKQNHSNVSKESWKPPGTSNIKQLAPKGVDAPWKLETSPFKEKHQNPDANLNATTLKESSSHSDDQRRENHQNTNKEAKKSPKYDASVQIPTFSGQESIEDYFQPSHHGNVNTTEKTVLNQETSQRKVCATLFEQEQAKTAKPQNASDSQNTLPTLPERRKRLHQVKNEQLLEVKSVLTTPKQIQSEQTEQSKAQQSVYGGHCKDDILQKIDFVEEEQVQTATTDKIVSNKVKLEQDETKDQKIEQVRGKEKDRTSEKQTDLTQAGKEETNHVKVQAEVMTGVQSESVRAKQGDLKDLKAKEGTLESVQKDNTNLVDIEAKQRIEKEGEKTQKVKTNNFTGDATIAMQISTEKVQLQTKTEHTSAKIEGKIAKNEQSDKKSEKESTVNAQPKEELNDAKEKKLIARQVELAKVELTNVELAKIALIKHQHKERSSRPPAKALQHQVKSEPNKVERVKTELAKAKAELSKIKNKTKGEQREKVRCTIITKEESGNNKDASADVADIQLTPQCNSSQDHHADDYYQALREKYGFNNLVSQKMSPGGNSSSNGGNVTSSALSFDVTKDNNDKSNNKNTTLNCESDNKDNLEFNKANESLYVYSESSKEFKLSQEDSLPACADKNIIGDIAIKGTDDNVKNKDLTHPDSTCTVPRQTHSESVQNPERKAKSEHLKAISQREKSKTKQQILTSKVKAHAEKEISALMEGFALREALTYKTSTKPLPDCPLKQKPYEVAKGHEIPISSNTTTKQQMASSGLEGKAVHTSEEMNNQMINQFQERTPQEPMKSNNLSPETAAPEMKTTAGQSENPDQQACSHKIKSPKQSHDQESKDPKENLVLQCSENNEKMTFESLSPKSDSPVQNIKSSSTPGKQGVLHKDFVFGQINNSVAEDSLQIMGISVTEVKVNNEHKVVNAEQSKDSSTEHDTYFQGTGLEMSKKSECLIHIGTANTRETRPIEKKTILDVSMNFENEETIEKSVPENLTAKIESSPLPCSITSVGPKSKIQVKETLPAYDVTPLNSINKVTDETRLLHNKQDATVAEMDERCTLETFDLTKNCNKDQEEIQTGEPDPQLKQEAAKVKNSGLNCIQQSEMALAVTQSATPSLEEDVTRAINPSEDSIKDKSALLLEENRYDSNTTYLNKIESKNTSPKLQEASKGIMNQVEDIYKDNTVVPVVPAVMVSCSFVTAVEELQHNIPSSASENMSASTKDQKAKQPESKSNEEQIQEKLEDKLSVQDVLASVKKLADSMKQMEQLNSINTAREDVKTDTAQTLGTMSNKQGSEGDYFQVEGIREGPCRNNNIQRDVSDVPKGVEHSERSSNESGLDSQGESMRKHKRAVIQKKSTLKQTECPSELLSCEKMVVAQTVDVEKRQSEFRSRERHNSRNSQLTREEPEMKSKPKVRISTIPEISALADYARLKVIVSEDRENTNPEFPPHKKEGFFPLIQSRHSRRPIFSADLQEHSVNKKIEPKKMEVINNTSRQPRAVVFPITEKEHQRTGMFKLGEKEKTEKTIFDVKDHEGVVEKQEQDLLQKKNMHSSHNETKVDRQEVPEVSRKIVSQFNKKEMLSSSINQPRESSQLQQNVSEIPNPDDKIKHLMLMEKNSSTKPTLESIYQDGTSKSRNTTNKNTSEIKFEPSRKAIFEIHPDGANAKQSGDPKDQPEEAFKRWEETIAGEENAKLDERRAFLSEERKRAQREAARWEKLKETAQRMEEERKAKQTKSKRWNPTEDDKKTEKENNREATPGERRVKERQVEQTAQEEEEMGALLMEEQRLTKRIEQRKLAEEIRLKKFQEHQDEQQRSVKQKSVPKTACENKEVTRPSETQIVGGKLREKQLNGSEKVRVPQLLQKEDGVAAKREENFVAQREKVSTSEEENREALLMDALQYYTITSTHKKPNERRKDSPPTLQQENPLSVPSERSGSQRKLHGPQAQPSPAPSLPRSTTSSPALGGKPLMFRVKDNTKGSSFKSVKPCFHKNLVDESRVGSPMDWRAEKREDEQEIMRRNTRTPINSKLVTGVNRLPPFKESHISQPVPSLNDNSTFLPHHRPFCRRSIALDEDDSRSVVSNMSEDVQSFATSVVDMAELKGLYDSDRPVSVCSFGSDMSRLGKPPAVPPKSDQALRKAQRLTTRRIRKEVTQNTSTNPVRKSQREASSRPASTSSEVWSSNRHALASPNFSPLVSLTHTPTFGPSLLSTHTEKQHSRLPLHTPPHATVPAISPHVTATEPHLHYPDAMPHPVALLTPSPISQPFPSAHAATPVPLPAASPSVITSTSPNTTPPVHSFIFPHVATAVPQQASTPGVTSPTSHSVASPHSTALSKHQVVSPHVPSPSCKPPYASAPASRSAASPHINALLNHPSSTLHVTASVAHPFPYMPAIVSHPVATPHTPNSFLMSSPNAAAQMTHPALASNNVQYVPSSPTLHYATQPAPVTQYHVESSYPQSYPLTQRKVLQDLGSGQYFLVDAPIEVKTKTFLDPETGKYVQLNVRESAQNIFRPHLQPVLTQPLFPQLNFQPQPQLEQQHKLFSHDSSAEKTFTLQKGYQSHPQFYTPPLTSSMSSQRSSSGVSVQDEANFKDNYITSRTNEIGEKFHSQRYSPEQTPYMDTVNDTNKTQKTNESFSDCETNKQLPGGLFENDKSVYSRCQPCDIISMSELDDFMDMSDW